VVAQLHELARTEQQGLDQIRLRHAAKAETRMLIPLVFLILPVSVLFALYPSLSMLQNIN
jgi:tight adherence protein C